MKTFDLERAKQLLIRAVNNRTRERNYFRLYNQLLEKEITEEEFNKELEENEEDYVVCNDKEVREKDVEIAMSLFPYLKDVNDMDSLADLFSFNDKAIHDMMKGTIL